jgi:hypothetical protein
MDAVLPCRAMAYNNSWANHRLLNACIRLSQAEFTALRTGFLPSLSATPLSAFLQLSALLLRQAAVTPTRFWNIVNNDI